jgi:prevent-host-death family protein
VKNRLGDLLVTPLADLVSVIEVGVHDAKTTLSELLRQVAAGEQVTITRSGEPVARTIPAQRRGWRVLGRDRRVFDVPEDFDVPLHRCSPPTRSSSATTAAALGELRSSRLTQIRKPATTPYENGRHTVRKRPTHRTRTADTPYENGRHTVRNRLTLPG